MDYNIFLFGQINFFFASFVNLFLWRKEMVGFDVTSKKENITKAFGNLNVM